MANRSFVSGHFHQGGGFIFVVHPADGGGGGKKEALANAVLGTVLRLLSLPLSCLTLGLFGFVVNALVFWEAGALTGATMNFWSALFGSVVVTLISSPLSAIVKG